MKTIPLTQGKFALVDDEDYDKYCLGRFDDLEKAVLAYNKKAKELFGNFTTPITSQEVMRPW